MSPGRWLPALMLVAACTADPPAPDPEPGPPVPATAASLLAIAEEHLGAGPGGEVDTEKIVDPSCGASYRHLFAGAAFDGRRLGLSLRVGRCHRDRYTCTPREHPRGVPLRRCTEEELPGGRVLVSGRLPLYQAPTELIAQVSGEVDGDAYAVVVGAEATSGWDLGELTDLASDPAYGPRVASTYVERGRELVEASGP